MEKLIMVKVSDLTNIFNQLTQLRSELLAIRDTEKYVRAYSIGEAASMMNITSSSVRALIRNGELHIKYLNTIDRECIVPYWSIKAYLENKD